MFYSSTSNATTYGTSNIFSKQCSLLPSRPSFAGLKSPTNIWYGAISTYEGKSTTLASGYEAPKNIWKAPLRHSHSSLSLFCLAWISNNLKKQIQDYAGYGLTCYLAACSTSLSNRKICVATTGSQIPVADTDNKENNDIGLESKIRNITVLLLASSQTKAHSLSQMKPSSDFTSLVDDENNIGLLLESFGCERGQLPQAFDCWIGNSSFSTNSYVQPNWNNEINTPSESKATRSTQDLGKGGIIHQIILPTLDNNDCSINIDVTKNQEESEIRGGRSPEGIPTTTFKLSRDYISSDSSEGFEDLTIKGPYDSLVRQNIFELLEDLDNQLDGQGRNESSLPIAQTKNSESSIRKDPVGLGLEEHLFVDSVNQTYTNRLRLQQRIKRLYGLKARGSCLPWIQKKGSSVSSFESFASERYAFDSLLKLEDRIDIQLFRLNWVSSILHARQVLKHKHIGVINRKDRSKSKVSSNLGLTLASSNSYLQTGDLLYWRNCGVSINGTLTNQLEDFDTTVENRVKIQRNYPYKRNPVGGGPKQSMNFHQFPWFGYIRNVSQSTDLIRKETTLSSSSFQKLAYTSEHTSLTDASCNIVGNTESYKATPVFALSNSIGSIKICTQLITAFENEIMIPQVGHWKDEIQKLSQYFETHYKYTYAIRTNQDLKLEYLRLPQSSIHKNEWKSFLESSRA